MRQKVNYFISRCNLLLFLAFITTLLSAQQKELNVLFIGNSYTYTNNLPQIVSIISDSTQTKLVTRKSVAGGAYLWEHWFGNRGLKTRELIQEGNFDIVVLQDNSMSAINTPDSLLKYIELFAELIKKRNAKTYLYNTWARMKVPQYQENIDSIYTKAANENNAIRVPVGAAWQLAMDIRPSVELYSSDGSHPTNLGTLLSAFVFAGTITGEVPSKLSRYFQVKDAYGEDIGLMHIDDLDIEFCRRVAEEICRR